MSDRERQVLYDLSYMWNLKKQETKLIDIENGLLHSRGRVGGGRKMGEGGQRWKEQNTGKHCSLPVLQMSVNGLAAASLDVF